MKNGMKSLLCLLLAIFISACTVSAAPKYKWVEKKQYYYFYNKEGKLYKNGIYKIQGKKYCFDAQGRQRTGWRKVNGGVYFFRDKNGPDGYMRRNTKIDGIYLNIYGRAELKTARNKKKLPLMLQVLEITDKITKPGMTLEEKKKICFKYAREHFREMTIPNLGRKNADWDITYAKFMLDRGVGDCFAYAAIFGYMANAIGCDKVLVVNDEGHGWTEIDGLFYDVEWSNVIGIDKCYAVPRALSGRDGRPNWAAYRSVVADVNK